MDSSCARARSKQVPDPADMSKDNSSQVATIRGSSEPDGVLAGNRADGHVRAADVPAFARPLALKSLLEFWLALALLPFGLCFIALSAILIKLEDGGPVFYRRRVIGREDQFDAFKLRTMRTDADDILRREASLAMEFARNFKLQNDPRVTRVGKHLRRWSIDELPQLFNVLKGQMALVGPRMITAPELEKYGAWARIFSSFKPGITGYWQVSGRQKINYEERVRMDVFYAQNWSLAFDLKILGSTLWKVVKREGAY
jgi:lipopolysaccharide/colanic/teichoic acid biosynthesis glycosyltransferase